jgi:hypothetical protein
VYGNKAKEAVKGILKDCATPGTIWNRHILRDDAIDIWREANTCLVKYGEPPVPFDAFYVALQQFKVECTQDFEGAVSTFTSRVKAESAVGSQKKNASRRGRKVA